MTTGSSGSVGVGSTGAAIAATPESKTGAGLVDLVVDEQGVHAEHAKGQEPDADESDRRHGKNELEIASNPTHGLNVGTGSTDTARIPDRSPTVPDSERM